MKMRLHKLLKFYHNCKSHFQENRHFISGVHLKSLHFETRMFIFDRHWPMTNSLNTKYKYHLLTYWAPTKHTCIHPFTHLHACTHMRAHTHTELHTYWAHSRHNFFIFWRRESKCVNLSKSEDGFSTITILSQIYYLHQ